MVTEGDPVEFRLTATPAPAAERQVNLSWDGIAHILGAAPSTVTIPVGGSVTVTANTTDNSRFDHDGAVFATVAAGTDYAPGTPDSAAVVVDDNDTDANALHEISVAATPSPVERGTMLTVTFIGATSTGSIRAQYDTSYRYMPSRWITKHYYGRITFPGRVTDEYVVRGEPTDRFIAVYIDKIRSPESLGFGDQTLVIVPIVDSQ